jgi:valyl-tRNA synthetase
VVLAAWPTGLVTGGAAPLVDGAAVDGPAEVLITQLQAVVTEVRRFRAEQGLRPAQRVPARIDGLTTGDLASFEEQIRSLARLQLPDDGFHETAAVVVGHSGRAVRVAVDLSGTIDVGKERARLTKAFDVAVNEIALAEAKLADEAFTAKAPAPVVDKIRARLHDAQAEVERLRGQLEALPPAPSQQ